MRQRLNAGPSCWYRILNARRKTLVKLNMPAIPTTLLAVRDKWTAFSRPKLLWIWATVCNPPEETSCHVHRYENPGKYRIRKRSPGIDCVRFDFRRLFVIALGYTFAIGASGFILCRRDARLPYWMEETASRNTNQNNQDDKRRAEHTTS